MNESRAVVPTAHASRYLQQLCKHWAHKFPVEFTPEHGEIKLPSGVTVLDASAEALSITLRTEEAGSLDQLEQVVADHIVRFAFREDLVFDWAREA
ncbi:DUF2218 domain-containing protein [Aureimonas sp. AU40]|uniref:DUF2218 domain-containing protein n=1 Tax=Aureimonas sp. AU40 TaxID=1637747 RepID=UPI000781E20C|nr:DUF2218 domain-containing protein [Aureimonas sp. AU40]